MDIKNKIIVLIKILGIGLNELVIDIDLDCGVFESIELEGVDKIYLHIFEDNENEELDMTFDFDDLTESDQLKVYNRLAIIYN